MRLTFLFALVVSNLIYSQNGWVLNTANIEFDLNYLSYKDSNICQLAAKNFGPTSPKVMVSTNGTNSWQIIDMFAFGYSDLHFNDAITGYLLDWQTNQISLRKTNNSGLSWGTVKTFTVGTGTYTNVYFINSSTGYLWGSSAVTKTTDGGSNWSGSAFSPVLGTTDMFFVDLNTGFINGTHLSSNCVAKTTNQGSNWQVTVVPAFCSKIEFADQQTGYAMTINSLLLKTTNSGETWTSINISPFETLLSMSVVDSDNLYLLAQFGKVLKTTNGGLNWSTQILPTSGLNVREVDFATLNTGIVLCSGGKFLKTTTGGEILGIQQTGNQIPLNFNLSQNFPNPFNPSTQVLFDIPKSSNIRLSVFDAVGREVALLVNEELKPGSYKYDWNAADFPSGIYFYKLTAGEFSDTKKMVLIK